ncbi:flagellin N-terminal helical domain-containing protein [Schwartzia succinivorans]|nr:flagellin [Schwartzia succinivorans]
MAMVIKNNKDSLNTVNTLNKNNKAKAKSMEKLSSGMRINSAADDASGLSISERMRTQIRSLEQDNANTQNGNSMMKVAEGAVASTVDILKTLKEKLINAANDTNTDADRATIQREFDQMVDQIDDNANVEFNGKKLLDGSHNSQVIEPGTKTCLTNTSFSEDTKKLTKLTDLKDFNGTSLGIHDTDTIVVSYVKQGETKVLSFTAKGLRFGDIFAKAPAKDDVVFGSATSAIGSDAYGNTVYTADDRNAITYRAKDPGIEGQISGLTICVMDNTGKLNKNANAILDNFTETIRAENPSPDNSIVLQIGTKANQAIKIGLSDMRSTALGLTATDGSKLNISTQANANAAINVVETALQKVLDMQTQIGSVEMRLGFTSSNIITSKENTQSSESVIRDTDMAAEMAEYTRNNVLEQASQSMLAQANQNSSAVLSLLQ